MAPAPSWASDTLPEGLKRLTVDDFARWRSIGSTALSPDGQWVTFAYSRWDTEDTLFVKPVTGEGQTHVVARGSAPRFSADSRWVAYYINPKDSDNGSAEGEAPAGSGRTGRGGEGGRARALELYELGTGATERWENVQDFTFADEGGALLIKKRKADRSAEHDGTDLIVRHLRSGEEELIAYVNEYALDEPGARLAYTVDGPGDESNGVHLLDLTTRSRVVLDAERGVEYRRLTWGTEKGTPSTDALAVLKGKEDEEWSQRANALLAWPSLTASTRPVVFDPRPSRDTADAREPDPFPDGWVLSERGPLRWSPDAGHLFVPTQPRLPAPKTLCKPMEKADTPSIPNMASRVGADGRPLGPEEVLDGQCPEFMADVDIWHVEDEQLQSVQMIRAERDRNRTYQGVVLLEPERSARPAAGGAAAGARVLSPRFVQLADTTMASVEISRNGQRVMGRDDRPYRSDWRPRYADYYLVELSTGERTPVLEKQLRTLGFSPDGKHYLYWKDAQVWSYEVESGAHVSLTSSLPVSFENVEYDRFGEKPPYGVAGWSQDSTAVILNHRYDLYLVPLDGSPPRNLTKGIGTEREIRFRLLDLYPDEEGVDLSKPQYLTAFGQWTKQAGFFRLQGGELEELLLEDARFGRPQKADSAGVVLYTREDFRTFPDYWVSGLDFRGPVRVTDANPQQEEYLWGHRILFDYYTADSVRLQGLLAIPDDYREGEKRPMIVDFYEKMSQNLHAYPRPVFRDTPMIAEYVSAGYLVLLPDIHYRLGATHQQMLECINLAIDKVEEMGYVDPERIGLHGHSFSGQGSTYIATHSDRFAAIVAGAAATDLVSDFNQLWKSSGTNQHGYDTYGQGRFATNPYDDLDLFIDQSAVFHAGRMNTPLLLLHGTADGSVEWLQAVEFYNGLRWFGKNVILLSYPGEPHHLRKHENQKDFQIRMRQFYDHYLMGKPAPKWMEQGRTFLQKERDLEMMKREGRGG